MFRGAVEAARSLFVSPPGLTSVAYAAASLTLAGVCVCVWASLLAAGIFEQTIVLSSSTDRSDVCGTALLEHDQGASNPQSRAFMATCIPGMGVFFMAVSPESKGALLWTLPPTPAFVVFMTRMSGAGFVAASMCMPFAGFRVSKHVILYLLVMRQD